MVKNINENEFEKEIEKGKVLVDFYASWCGPCKMLSPVIEEFSEKYSDIKFLKVNVDNELQLAQKFNVMSIPTLILFEDGKEIKKNIGLLSKTDLEEFIK
jgi:thioredoxin 1